MSSLHGLMSSSSVGEEYGGWLPPGSVSGNRTVVFLWRNWACISLFIFRNESVPLPLFGNFIGSYYAYLSLGQISLLLSVRHSPNNPCRPSPHPHWTTPHIRYDSHPRNSLYIAIHSTIRIRHTPLFYLFGNDLHISTSDFICPSANIQIHSSIHAWSLPYRYYHPSINIIRTPQATHLCIALYSSHHSHNTLGQVHASVHF